MAKEPCGSVYPLLAGGAEAKERKNQQSAHTPIFETTTTTKTIIVSEIAKKFDTAANYRPTSNLNNEQSSIKTISGESGFASTPSVELHKLLKSTVNVHVLFKLNDMQSVGPLTQQTIPHNSLYTKGDDKKLVKLPHDSSNTKIKVVQREKSQIKKWEIITIELASVNSLLNSENSLGLILKEAIKKYNSKVESFSFTLLNNDGIANTLRHVLPFVIKAACEMPELFPKGVPILAQSFHKTLFLRQNQIASILTNAFFCTFPKRSEDLPDINFQELFGASNSSEAAVKIEKLKSILHYFKRLRDIQSEGNVVSFERRVLKNPPFWEYSKERMSEVKVKVNGSIENAHGCLQVDFANRFVGGGILGRGAVMEEIRFCICPELIAARLFTEKLEKDEVLIVTGCEQFTTYSGYGDNFKCSGDFKDVQPLDKFGRKQTQIVAMDAYHFREGESYKQFSSNLVDRELNKCYCAFQPNGHHESTKPIATGNWGCGIFNGDTQLKFIIQWMAASQAKQRKIVYFTSGIEQQSEIIEVIKHLERSHISVGLLYRAISRYNRTVVDNRGHKTLFRYLLTQDKFW